MFTPPNFLYLKHHAQFLMESFFQNIKFITQIIIIIFTLIANGLEIF